MAADIRPSALLLAPETPYPLTGGGALRTASLLHYLAQAHHVDLIVFRQPGGPDPAQRMPAGLVRRMTVIDLPANGRILAARAFPFLPTLRRWSGMSASTPRTQASAPSPTCRNRTWHS